LNLTPIYYVSISNAWKVKEKVAARKFFGLARTGVGEFSSRADKSRFARARRSRGVVHINTAAPEREVE